MQQPDQTDKLTSTTEEVEDHSIVEHGASQVSMSGASTSLHSLRFDGFGVGIIVIIAAIFTAAARLNQQPASSLVPVTVLSATGCGLLITGLRKLRAFNGVGLLEAALSGALLALFQFVAALSFPGVVQELSADSGSRPGFFTTWALVAVFTTLFSLVGATLGHLVFAPLRPLRPLRPLPARAAKVPTGASETNESDEGENESASEPAEDLLEQSDIESENRESEELSSTDDVDDDAEAATENPPTRSGMSYIISILLLGLAPFVAGYIFAAAFDFALNLNQYDPGPFPTLRLLSALLPWQVPLAVNSPILNLTLVWRIPLAIGNPTAFDIQAIEPFVLNAAGLACALLGTFWLERPAARISWRSLLLLEALLGLVLVLPANLWIAFGLHGLLQIQSIAVLLRTLQLLNPFTFILNLITAPLVCIIIGTVIVRTRRNSTKYSR